jgi:hypothetical protein
MSRPNFEAWEHANLVKFAHESYARLLEQQEDLTHLRADLKAAIEAYRALLREMQC